MFLKEFLNVYNLCLFFDCFAFLRNICITYNALISNKGLLLDYSYLLFTNNELDETKNITKAYLNHFILKLNWF